MKRTSNVRTLVIVILLLSMCLSFASCASSTAPQSSSAPPSGSSQTPPSGEPTGNENPDWLTDTPVTFTMLYADEATAPYKAEWPTLVEMAERTNVTLKMEVVAVSDWETKLQTVLYSGDMPDIINRVSGTTELALNGKLLPFSDYLDQMPELSARIVEYGWDALMDTHRLVDGKFYTLPVNAYEARFQPITLFIMQNVLDDLNLQMPTDFDELYEVLKAIKADNPDMYPWANKYGSWLSLGIIQNSFGARTDGPTRFAYDADKDEWYFGITTENFKQALQYLAKLYAEGLLHPEFATMEDSVMMQKIIEGTAVVFPDWITYCIPFYTPEGVLNNPDFEIAPIPPLAGPDGIRSLGSVGQASFSMCSPITIQNSPNFDVFLKFIDWMYKIDGGVNLFSWGIEGATYKVVDGQKQFLPDIQTEVNEAGTLQLNRDFGAQNNNLSFVYPLDSVLAQMSAETADYVSMLAANDYVPSRQPSIKLTSEDSEEISIAVTAITSYTDQMIDTFIMGKESFDNWDKFVAECEAKGAAKLKEVYNRAWQRQNGN